MAPEDDGDPDRPRPDPIPTAAASTGAGARRPRRTASVVVVVAEDRRDVDGGVERRRRSTTAASGLERRQSSVNSGATPRSSASGRPLQVGAEQHLERPRRARARATSAQSSHPTGRRIRNPGFVPQRSDGVAHHADQRKRRSAPADRPKGRGAPRPMGPTGRTHQPMTPAPAGRQGDTRRPTSPQPTTPGRRARGAHRCRTSCTDWAGSPPAAAGP